MSCGCNSNAQPETSSLETVDTVSDEGTSSDFCPKCFSFWLFLLLLILLFFSRRR